MIELEALAQSSQPNHTLVLLTSNCLFANVVQQYLAELPNAELVRCPAAPPDLSGTSLVLLDTDTFSVQESLAILQRCRGTTAALVNAGGDTARHLVYRHPWVRGVFYRATPRQHLVAGVRTLMSGGDWLPRSLMEQLVQIYRRKTQTSDSIAELSRREKQILLLAGKGLSNNDIAEAVHLSVHTVKSHIHNALNKIGATNRAQGAAMLISQVESDD